MTMKLYCFGESGNAYKAALFLALADADWNLVIDADDHGRLLAGVADGLDLDQVVRPGQKPCWRGSWLYSARLRRNGRWMILGRIKIIRNHESVSKDRSLFVVEMTVI